MNQQQQHAWVRLGSGRRLDLLNPRPDGWTDEDLATGLARTNRWGGTSLWPLPLSVAQHSLTVLAIREQQERRTLPPAHALRELLHDADEALIGGWDCPAPLKPHLGEPYARLVQRLRVAIASRYGLPVWNAEDYILHKQADRLAAASEAVHVVGYSREDVCNDLMIGLAPLADDPLQRDCMAPPKELRPWEPWPPALAYRQFLGRLEELAEAAAREAKLAALASAFSRMPARQRARCSQPVTGSPLLDTLVFAEAHDGSAWHEGIIVAGERDEDGAWELDAEFRILTTDDEGAGELILVKGYNCNVEVL